MKSIFAALIVVFGFQQMAFAKVYKIKANKHDSGNHFGFFMKSSMEFEAKFEDSAAYSLGNSNQADINKLYGFSDCYSGHQKNSARFGWVWNDLTSKLEIHAYSYANSVRSSAFIDTVERNQFYNYKIVVHEDSYEFILNNKSVSLTRHCDEKRAHGYKLYPYFGGDEVAPHEIKIEVKKL